MPEALFQRPLKQGIRAVAARAGVSTASVSRALNHPDSVSTGLRTRIAEAVQSVGYIPHASARALSSRRTRTLGAIIPTIDNTMFARGIAALQKYLSSVGYMLLLTTSGYDLDAELEQARNDAEKYRNDILPRARGDAQQVIQGAAAYKDATIAKATGEAAQFISVLDAYKAARDVTARRLYIETMEAILQHSRKIIIDPNADGKNGVVPYLPLPALNPPASSGKGQ